MEENEIFVEELIERLMEYYSRKVVSVNLNWRESRVCLDQRLIAMKRES